MTENRVFTLKENDNVLCEIPVLSGTNRPDVLDIKSLYSQTGLFAYDPGFYSTASCSSTITYVDDKIGMLFYRGYPIVELVQHATFLRPVIYCFTVNYPRLKNYMNLNKKSRPKHSFMIN